MKKTIVATVALSLALPLAASPAVLAQPTKAATKSPAYTKANITVYSHNKKITFPRSPVIVNDVILVPLRDMFNSLGATVYWDEKTRTVTAQKGQDKVILTIGKKSGTKNGKAMTFSTAPAIINGTTMVPARLAAESFDLSVTWDAKKKAIFIENKKQADAQPKPNPPAESALEPDEKEQATLQTKLLAMQLAEAVTSGSSTGVQTALAAGANPNASLDHTGMTPLMSAVSTKNLAMARTLLNGKADPNIQNDKGWTALIYAVQQNNTEAISLLLAYKADTSIRTKTGEDALSLAYTLGYTNAAHMLSPLSFREAADIDQLQTMLASSVIDGISENDLGLRQNEAVMYLTLADDNAAKTFRALSDAAKRELIYSAALQNWNDVKGVDTCRVLIRFDGRTLAAADLASNMPLSAVKLN